MRCSRRYVYQERKMVMTDIEIMKKYKFFKPKSKSSLMAFGFDCDKGWFPMLDELCKQIQETKPPKNFEVVQVKEKLAGLRFYTHNSTEKINCLIRGYELRSGITCEICGKTTGELRKREFWLKTLCQKCNKLWQKFDNNKNWKDMGIKSSYPLPKPQSNCCKVDAFQKKRVYYCSKCKKKCFIHSKI